MARTVEEVLDEVDELCQMGLNSSEPKHWEAALQDILDLVRDEKELPRRKFTA